MNDKPMFPESIQHGLGWEGMFASVFFSTFLATSSSTAVTNEK
jgi:hypothetical protein